MAKSTCSVDGCDSPLRTIKSGLCEKHYYRNRRWGDPNVVRKIAKYEDGATCSAAQCDRAVFSLGLCSRHYAKYRKYGNAEHPPQPRGPQPKPPKVCSVDGCPFHAKARNLCAPHYRRLMKYGDVHAARKVHQYPDDSECLVDECRERPESRGMCSKHVQRYRASGFTELTPRVRPMPDHGTVARYTRGCRCDECRSASAERKRRYKREHPESFAATSATQEYRRRAREMGADHRLVTERDWRRLVLRYNGCCAYCGASGKPLTREHVVPFARGGRHSIGNLLPVCGTCNSSKRDRLLIEWRTRLPIAV